MRGLFGARHGEAAPLVSLDSKLQALQVPSGECKGLGELQSNPRASMMVSCKALRTVWRPCKLPQSVQGLFTLGCGMGRRPPW